MKYFISIGFLGISFCTLLIIALLIQPTNILSYEAQLKVDKYVGLNTQTEKLYFGAIPPGNKGFRTIQLGSQKERYTTIHFEGNIAPFIRVEEQSFTFQGNKNVKIEALVPKETVYGNYTGTITVKFYDPLAQYFLP